jgi:PAS domain S-box-containing protein
VVWTLALLCAAVATAFVLTSDHNVNTAAGLGLSVPIGLTFIAGGLIACARRPDNRTGLLMVLTGFVWFFGALTAANDSLLFSIGSAFGALVYGFFILLVVAYPTGRLETRLDRLVVVAGFAFTAVLWPGSLLFDDLDDGPLRCEECPENAFLVVENSTVSGAIHVVVTVAALAIATAAVAALARRWRQATPVLRRALTPVYVTGSIAISMAALRLLYGSLTDAGDLVAAAVQYAALLTVPLAFMFGLLRSRLARGRAGGLLLEVPEGATLEQAQTGLQHALGDPTLQLAYWVPEEQRYVDTEGRPLELPADTTSRVITMVEYEDRPVAALIHDVALRNEPELLEQVVAAARIGLEKDRTLHQLRQSEARTTALLNAIPDLMFRIDASGRYLDFKAEEERDLVTPASEVIGRRVFDRLPPGVAEPIMQAARRALAEGGIQTVEYDLDFDGDVRHYEGRLVAGGEDEVLMIVRDFTERRRLQNELNDRMEELRIERDLVRTVVDTAPTLLCGVDPDGCIVRFNKALERLSGHLDRGSVRGRPFWEVFVTPGHAREVERCFRAACAGSADGDFEHLWQKAGGEEAVVAWSVNGYPGEHGEARYLITGTDVTRRKRAEAELAAMAEEQAALRRVATLVASEVEPESIFQLVTEEAARVLGAQSSALIRFEEGVGRIVGRWHGTGPQGFEIGSVIPLEGDTALPRLFRTGQPARMEGYEHAQGEAGRTMHALGFRSAVTAPVNVAGRLWGALVVATTRPEPLPPDTEGRLDAFAELVALALASADARGELIVSRARIVQAGDAERRRLERNLHDGAQQRLVGLSLSLRLAQGALGKSPDEARQLLERCKEELAQALEDLRELARGIHPAVLTDRGLEPALEALAARSPVPVDIDAPDERLPEPVEAAAYYVVSEALANVAKYAGASEVAVRVAHDDGRVVIEVADDGIGGADPRSGTGLRGLADRLSALEGRLDITSPSGQGTRIRAEIPLRSTETATP